ncbi:MAG: YheT family hydrolase [Planctomycetota bacterium JB042]
MRGVMRAAPDPDPFPAFEPHPWLANRHAMTLAGAFAPRRRGRLDPGERRVFRTDDETRVVAWCHWQSDRRRPVVLLVHGLTGSADSGYMRGTAEKAFGAGFSAVRLNVRNCGGTEHLTPTLYHAALTADVRAVIEELAWKDRVSALFVAGFSLGGNLVLRTLAELGDRGPAALRGAVAVSTPLDLEASAAALESTRLNRLYMRRFVKDLARVYRRKVALFPERYRIESLEGVETLRQFDDRITAPYSGFGNARRYYALASSLPVLPGVRVPTLLLSARDDSMVPAECYDRREVRESDALQVKTTARGGHLAFIGRGPARDGRGGDPDRRWAENRVVEWFRRIDGSR